MGTGLTDSHGYILKMTSLDKNIAEGDQEFTYNVNGRLLKSKGEREERFYEYDQGGRRVKLTLQTIGKERIESYVYGDDGKLLRLEDETGRTLYRFEYLEFDGQGNWTKRKCFFSNGQHRVDTRKITYWE